MVVHAVPAVSGVTAVVVWVVCRSYTHTLSQQEYLAAARGWEFPPIPGGVPAGGPLTLSVDEVAVVDEKSAMYTYLAGKVLRGIGRKAEAKLFFQVGGDVPTTVFGAGEGALFGSNSDQFGPNSTEFGV